MNAPPTPPASAVMPAAELPITIVWGVLALASVGYCVGKAVRGRSALPVAVLAGACLSMFAEALVCNSMHAWYPAVGQINAWVSYGRSVPLFVAFAYVFFFAPGILYFMDRFRRGVTVRQVWTFYLGAVVGVFCYEYVGLLTGVWLYYGEQPFELAGFPVTYAFTNSALIFVPAVVLHLLRDRLVGWRPLAVVVVLMATQVSGLEMLVGYPNYVAINSGVPMPVASVAALLSIGIGLLVVWLSAQAVCTDGAFRGRAPVEVA